MPGYTPSMRLRSNKDYYLMTGDHVQVNKGKYTCLQGVVVSGGGGQDKNPSLNVAIILNGMKKTITIVQSRLTLQTSSTTHHYSPQNFPVALSVILPVAQLVSVTAVPFFGYGVLPPRNTGIAVAVAVAVVVSAPVNTAPVEPTTIAVVNDVLTSTPVPQSAEPLNPDSKQESVAISEASIAVTPPSTTTLSVNENQEDTAPFVDISDTWDVPKEVFSDDVVSHAEIEKEQTEVLIPDVVRDASSSSVVEPANPTQSVDVVVVSADISTTAVEKDKDSEDSSMFDLENAMSTLSTNTSTTDGSLPTTAVESIPVTFVAAISAAPTAATETTATSITTDGNEEEEEVPSEMLDLENAMTALFRLMSTQQRERVLRRLSAAGEVKK